MTSMSLFSFSIHSFVIAYGFFFFFQAEDGIRDRDVTGVQTCALPIYPVVLPSRGYASPGAHRHRADRSGDPYGRRGEPLPLPDREAERDAGAPSGQRI